MSLSWICWKPRMLEPSKPMPSSNRSSLRSSTGMEKCCQTPGRSTKRKSTMEILDSSAKRLTSFTVFAILLSLGAVPSNTLLKCTQQVNQRLLPKGQDQCLAYHSCPASGTDSQKQESQLFIRHLLQRQDNSPFFG